MYIVCNIWRFRLLLLRSFFLVLHHKGLYFVNVGILWGEFLFRRILKRKKRRIFDETHHFSPYNKYIRAKVSTYLLVYLQRELSFRIEDMEKILAGFSKTCVRGEQHFFL